MRTSKSRLVDHRNTHGTDERTSPARLGHVAKSRGMAEMSEKTRLGRESLYKTLKAGANPQHNTIMKITRALGGENDDS